MLRVTSYALQVWLPLLAFSLTMSACSGLPKGVTDFDVGTKQRGTASWYGVPFDGQVTASGEIYDMEALTGAHRTLPPGTVVKVTNAENGKQVRVRINDRGPYVGGRIMDLSYAAARALQMVQAGIAPVQLEVVGNQASELRLSVDRFTLVPHLFDLVGDAPESTDPGTVQAQDWRLSIHPSDILLRRRAMRAFAKRSKGCIHNVHMIRLHASGTSAIAESP